MNLKLLCRMFLVIVLAAVPVWAQDATPKSCDAAGIQQAVDELTAAYAADNGGTDSTAALEAATTMRDALDTLVESCANQPEATPTAEPLENTGMPVAGQWRITWDEEGTFNCADGSYNVLRHNRPIILRYEGDALLMEDLFIWPILEFTEAEDSTYFYRRNVALNDGSHFSFEYHLLTLDAEEITGTAITFYDRVDCTLEGTFTLTFENPDLVCLVGAHRGANLRSGPGTDFDRVGRLVAEDLYVVSGQVTGDDGFVWWKLIDDAGWIRSDLVEETTLCATVPESE
ncbi:MAG: SH3 domain-containing protein [Anaerolineae bacterium]|nr:SH3 domain-containing protein [Anaerolineae bacterium]